MVKRSLLTIPEQPEVPDSVQKQEKTQDAKVEQTQNNFLLSETVLAHLPRDRGGADAVPGPVGPTTKEASRVLANLHRMRVCWLRLGSAL